MDDDELREELRMIDEGDAAIDTWEADFIENVVFKMAGLAMSERQREWAEKIVEKYGN